MTTPLDPLMPCVPQQKTLTWPKHKYGPRVPYYPLSKLLTMDHTTDAHFAGYSAPSKERRLCTEPPAYEQIDGGVPMYVLAFDLDCGAAHRASGGSEKVPADDAWWESQRPGLTRLLAAHPGGFVFRTRGGARIVYRLPSPVWIRKGADEITWKRLYLSHIAMIARVFEVVCDAAISEWSRLARLPRVMRDRVPQRFETIGDPHHVGVLSYMPTPADAEGDMATSRDLARHTPAWNAAVRILGSPLTLSSDKIARAPRAARAVTARALEPSQFDSLAVDLGHVMRRYHGRHLIHLALAGACYARGIPLTQGPSLARAICMATGESDDRPQVWHTTAERITHGRAVSGFATLQRMAPDLAEVVNAALPVDGGARGVRDALDAIGIPDAVPAADAAAKIRHAIEHAEIGFSVLRVTEGAGKTQAAAEIAVARARAAKGRTVVRMQSPGRDLEGAKCLACRAARDIARNSDALATCEECGATYRAHREAKSSERTLIVTDKHAVAERLASRLSEAGVSAEYWRSVLSVRASDGSPACGFFVPVAALARGRQSAVATFCEGIGMGDKGNQPCPNQSSCDAYQNSVVRIHPQPGTSPSVVITVHAKLGEALAWAGESALVLIDEDPRAVEPFSFSREQLDAAAKLHGSFAQFELWRTVVLRAIAAGMAGAEPGEEIIKMITRGCEDLGRVAEWRDDAERLYGTTDARQIIHAFAIRSAYRRTREGVWERRATFAPRLHRREHARVFNGASLNPDVADASLVHTVIAQAIAGNTKIVPDGARPHGQEAAVVIDHEMNGTALRILTTSPAVTEALRRYGQTVLLDATADASALSAIAGYEIEPIDVRVADGAPIERRLLYYSNASRGRVLPKGEPIAWEGIERYIREAIAWALSRIKVAAIAVALFTWKPLAEVFRAAWAGEHGADPVATGLLEPIRARGGTVLTGHYGGVRGRDDWMDCDAFVSIGDPRPNLGASHAVAAAIGLGDERDVVYRHATAAESSQVAGRTRCPWREKPGVQIIVGSVVPLSWDARAEVVELPKGARDAAIVPGDDSVRVYGSRRGLARATGIAESSLRSTLSNSIATVSVRGVSLSNRNMYGFTPRTDNASQSLEKDLFSTNSTDPTDGADA